MCVQHGGPGGKGYTGEAVLAPRDWHDLAQRPECGLSASTTHALTAACSCVADRSVWCVCSMAGLEERVTREKQCLSLVTGTTRRRGPSAASPPPRPAHFEVSTLQSFRIDATFFARVT